jgi:hypothetical protein
MAERQHIIGQLVDETALDNLAMELATQYQKNLAEMKVNATGALSRAAINYIFSWKGDTLMLIFRLPEEWYYVEHGRDKTTGKTGKPWPNAVDDILQWIRIKRIVPRTPMRSARVPKSRMPVPKAVEERRMAEAIVRKIHREGFYSPNHHGLHPLEKAVEEVAIKERLRGILVDALGKEIRVELADAVTHIKK